MLFIACVAISGAVLAQQGGAAPAAVKADTSKKMEAKKPVKKVPATKAPAPAPAKKDEKPAEKK